LPCPPALLLITQAYPPTPSPHAPRLSPRSCPAVIPRAATAAPPGGADVVERS
jgi:hypothetical protein